MHVFCCYTAQDGIENGGASAPRDKLNISLIIVESFTEYA